MARASAPTAASASTWCPRAACALSRTKASCEIEESHLELIFIDLCGRQVLLDLDRDLDLRTGRTRNQIPHPADEVPHLGRSGLEWLPPCKCEQALHKRL